MEFLFWKQLIFWSAQWITRRHIPEDDTLKNHRCENLKSYIFNIFICFSFCPIAALFILLYLWLRRVTHVKISLLGAHKEFLVLSFSNRVYSLDNTNDLVALCSSGASIELVKKKVLEMFIFLNLTLHSFGPENFVPLVQIVKFQKCLTEDNESYKMAYYT
jgi:hypothetical protein